MPDRYLISAVGAVIEVDVSRRGADFQRRAHGAWVDARYEGDLEPDAVVEASPELGDDAALSKLSTDVTIAALAQRRGDSIWMLHAAGLADESGNVVVLSAASGTGKTTAARHLSHRYAYVSDETIGIDADGGVVPYRKPLSIIQPHSAHKTQVALSSFDGGRPLPERLRVAKIVVIDRSADGPEHPVIEPLDTFEALELLGPQTSYLCEGDAPLHRIGALLSATGGAVRLHYREVGSIDQVIDELIRTKIRQVTAPSTLAGGTSASPSRLGAYRQAEVVDQLDLDGRIALLQRAPSGGRVYILDGIGPTLWAAAQAGSIEEMVDAVVAVHGAPAGGNAHAIVEAAVQELVADGLLREPTAQS